MKGTSSSGGTRDWYLMHYSTPLHNRRPETHTHTHTHTRLHDVVPKIVCNHFSQVNSIEKCLWILWKQFKFIATKKMKLFFIESIKNTLRILQLCHFPILLLVNSKNAVYDHVVVIWQGRVIDYESKNIYMLTNDSLQQICGANTFFSHVSCGYGLFPCAGIRC